MPDTLTGELSTYDQTIQSRYATPCPIASPLTFFSRKLQTLFMVHPSGEDPKLLVHSSCWRRCLRDSKSQLYLQGHKRDRPFPQEQIFQPQLHVDNGLISVEVAESMVN